MIILADASLPSLKELMPAHHTLRLYHDKNSLDAGLLEADALLCRSTLKVNQELLKHASIKKVATASSGSDHLDKVWLENAGIAFFDAKGSNAKAVGDYVLSVLACLYRKGLIKGNKTAIVGMGHVGSSLSPRLLARGFSCKEYDPPREMRDVAFKSSDFDEVLDADIILIHAELSNEAPYKSHHLFNAAVFDAIKPNAIIINAARGHIVDEAALLERQDKIIYCTDVYANEPDINQKIIDMALIATPHIAGHSIEAKFQATKMAIEQLVGLPKIAPSSKHLALDSDDWIDKCLSLYHPIIETNLMKTGKNPAESFLNLRRLHDFRHDFPFS